MRIALRAREVTVPDLTNRTANDATALASDLGLTLRVDDTRRPDPKIAAGRVLAQEPAAGSIARRQRSVRVWLSAGQRVGHGTAAGRRNRADRAAAARPGRPDADAVLPRFDPRRIAPDVVVAQMPPAKTRGGQRRAARQPRRARRQLRDARSDRRQRRSRGRDPARPRLSRRGRRIESVSRRRRRHRPPPESAGRISDRTGRADLARGEPVSVLIAPSILSADFAALGDAIARRRARRRRSDSRRRHGRPLRAEHHHRPAGREVDSSGSRSVPLDVHLMITDPDRYIDAFAEAGAAMISVHVEVLPHLHRTVHAIKALGVKAGVVLNPSTPVGALEEIAGDVDFVLVMSVNPGFGGQTFIPRSESKVRAVRALLDRGRQPARRSRSTAASTSRTSARVVAAGARIVVAGSAVFHTPDPERATRELKAAALAGRPAACRSSVSAPPVHFPRARALRRNRHRWAWSTTPTTSSGSKSAAPICCAQAGWSYREMEADGYSLPVIEAQCAYQPVGAVRRRARGADDAARCCRRCGCSSATRSCGPPTHALARHRHTPCTPRSIATAARAGCRSACATLFS